MAGLSRSNKVSRAARTGSSGRRRGESSFGFYALLLVLVLVGTASVVYSRNERLEPLTPNMTAPLEAVNNSTSGESAGTDASLNREGDYWYQAYGLYICDKFVPPINSDSNPYGLATANDGIIYIHPAAKAYAGDRATLGLFSDGVKLALTRNSIKVPGDDTTYTDGQTKCGDTTGELVVKEWADPTKPNEGRILTSNPRNMKVRNGAAITIAFVPEGKTDIPLPDSATNGALQAAPSKDPNRQSAAAAQTETSVPATGEAPVTSAPAAPATTAAP